MHHVRELDGIPDKENREVVPHQIVVSLFGIELHCKASRVPKGICRAFRSHNCREAHEDRCLRLRILKKFCLGVFYHALVDLKKAMGACSLGVDHALRDSLPVEIGQLLDHMHILKQYGATLTHGQ